MRNQLSYLFLAMLLCLGNHAAYAQKKDAIYLKNGSIIRGDIIDSSQAALRLKTSDGSEMVFERADIAKTTREALHKPYQVWNKHFYNLTQMGFLAGNNNGYGAGFSMNTINGYRFNPYLAVGGSVGFDIVDGDLILPLALDVRGLCIQRNISPYYFGQLGYGFPKIGENERGIDSYRGGPMYQLGFGMQFRLSESTAFLFETGYFSQAYSYDSNWGWERIHEDIVLRRIAFRVGFMF